LADQTGGSTGSRLAKSEHILMESDERVIPHRQTARKVHARLLYRSRLRRRAVLLEVIDYYFLSVQIWRAGSLTSEYVLDLRFIDPVLQRSRHVAWRWIGVTLSFVAVLSFVLWWAVRFSSVPWWQPERLAVYAIILALGACAGAVSMYRTTESWSVRSVNGKAEVLACTGGLGTLRAIGPFAAKLVAHVRIAIAARRPSKNEHLRDEMREHFRLKEAGVLSDEAYEASKTRILGTHTTTSAARS
jgi:hypothetical protein